MINLTITDIKIEKLEDVKTKLVAYATVTIDEEITIHKIKMLPKDKGIYFIAFPSRKNEDKYYSLVDVSSNLYKMINNEIISEYKRINEE